MLTKEELKPGCHFRWKSKGRWKELTVLAIGRWGIAFNGKVDAVHCHTKGTSHTDGRAQRYIKLDAALEKGVALRTVE